MVVALFYKEKSLFVFFITFVIFFVLVAERGIQLRNLAFNYVPVMGLL
ncbi:trk system potassium uptake trkG domain protein [Escherichia coli 2-005-03_S1_C1]|nr:trk system potassium uptake trkG domain protein [Escherichia coli 2-005-03_S1_C1]KDA64391.1 trk system potassium uptake trkG domain protein [Escherichia coli 2-052-05_S1_C1]KDW42035.1 trk system potassium uptake trkG domain protein [Escherichia coli 2-177-06_S1_C3]